MNTREVNFAYNFIIKTLSGKEYTILDLKKLDIVYTLDTDRIGQPDHDDLHEKTDNLSNELIQNLLNRNFIYAVDKSDNVNKVLLISSIETIDYSWEILGKDSL